MAALYWEEIRRRCLTQGSIATFVLSVRSLKFQCLCCALAEANDFKYSDSCSTRRNKLTECLGDPFCYLVSVFFLSDSCSQGPPHSESAVSLDLCRTTTPPSSTALSSDFLSFRKLLFHSDFFFCSSSYFVSVSTNISPFLLFSLLGKCQ